jgi:hypothetical protein
MEGSGMNRTTQHALRALLLGVVATLTMSSAALAQEYPPAVPPHAGNLHASVSSDGVVEVSGEECGAEEAVAITFGGTEIATATTDAAGTFATSFDVPEGTAAGSHTVVAHNDVCELTTTVTVSAAGEGDGEENEGALPFTGSNSGTFLMAIMALVIGAGMVALARNRRGLAKALRA